MCVDKYKGVMEGILARRRLAAQNLVGPRGGGWLWMHEILHIRNSALNDNNHHEVRSAEKLG
jgi:hypothetical protein